MKITVEYEDGSTVFYDDGGSGNLAPVVDYANTIVRQLKFVAHEGRQEPNGPTEDPFDFDLDPGSI